jgi:acetyltransferase-like isoleucine patch superfamily enzyme
MNKEFSGSIHKELVDQKKSLFSKYALLFVGEKSFFGLLKYELITGLFSWIPGGMGLVLRKLFYRFLFREVGRGVVFGRNINVRHTRKIRIGDNSFIDDNAVLDAKGEKNDGIRIGGDVYIGRNSILSCKEGSIVLDDFCNISANCSLLSETEIRLGKYCFLAGHCYLVAGGNHRFDRTDIPIMFQPSYSKGGIQIADDVWLAAGTVVLDGVSVGRGSVVGAGSVVTGSLPEFSVAFGTPAHRVRDRREPEGPPAR